MNEYVNWLSENFLSQSSLDWIKTAFTILAAIVGAIFARDFLWLKRKSRQADALAIELQRSLERKDIAISEYVKTIDEQDELIASKNAEIESYKSFFPDDDDVAHRLFHEIQYLMNYIGSAAQQGEQFQEDSAQYQGPPLAWQFLDASASLLARARLATEKTYGCARHQIARDLQNRYMRVAWINSNAHGIMSLFGTMDKKVVSADLEEIEFLIKLCQRFSNEAAADLFISTKILMIMLPTDLIDSESKQVCLSSIRSDIDQLSGSQTVGAAISESIFPNSFSCFALSKMKRGESRLKAGLTDAVISRLIDGGDLGPELHNVLLLERSGVDTRSRYNWDATISSTTGL